MASSSSPPLRSPSITAHEGKFCGSPHKAEDRDELEKRLAEAVKEPLEQTAAGAAAQAPEKALPNATEHSTGGATTEVAERTLPKPPEDRPRSESTGSLGSSDSFTNLFS